MISVVPTVRFGARALPVERASVMAIVKLIAGIRSPARAVRVLA